MSVIKSDEIGKQNNIEDVSKKDITEDIEL
jgi:hypothetical protein